jgi:hypothetical protein
MREGGARKALRGHSTSPSRHHIKYTTNTPIIKTKKHQFITTTTAVYINKLFIYASL